MRLRFTEPFKIGMRVAAAVIAVVWLIGMGTPAMAEREETYEALKLFSDVLQEIEAGYVDKVDADQLIQDAITGMVGSLDPHSSFMPPEAFDELQDDTKGEFGGIGIVISMRKGVLTVVSPIEGTPAYRAGILAGDVIVEIDGESTADMALWESVKKMRGPRGKTVELTIVRQGEADPLVFTLERDIIPMTSVRSVTLEPGYGYVWVTNFRNNTSKELATALETLESEKAPLKGLILDLRNNPGGLLDQAVAVSDAFLDTGMIVSIKGRQAHHNEVFNATPGEVKRTYPMVVLINGGSASASEIVAGALQDHGRALILGTTSFGKGSVQTVKPLKGGFGLKYTIARYYTPNGRSIQAQGIVPDIPVPFQPVAAADADGDGDAPRKTGHHMLRERDLKNHLEPEKAPRKGGSAKETVEPMGPMPGGPIALPRLQKDNQVRRALDILKGYHLLCRSAGNDR